MPKVHPELAMNEEMGQKTVSNRDGITLFAGDVEKSLISSVGFDLYAAFHSNTDYFSGSLDSVVTRYAIMTPLR